MLYLPEDLHGIVEAVLGLDNRPQAKAHFRLRRPVAGVISHAAAPASYSPTQVASLYDFPPGSGAKQTIGIIELGGGFRPADLQTYFTSLGLPLPDVTAVPVDQGANAPTGSADGPDAEVMLDIEVAGAIAPDAKIVVYFAPNTDAGFLDAVTAAVHDATNKPSVISISWGGPESSWTSQAMTAFDQAFQAAATLGVTVCVASGDNGSSDGSTDGANQVTPRVESLRARLRRHDLEVRRRPNCLGNRLERRGERRRNGRRRERILRAARLADGTRRNEPRERNAARHARRSRRLRRRGTRHRLQRARRRKRYDGRRHECGRPLWAGLIARINGSVATTAGYLNPRLYASPSACNDVTSGNNGSYSASAGWDACTGLGTRKAKRSQHCSSNAAEEGVA